MSNLVKNTPHIPVVLASLILWAALAWRLPADAPADEAEAEVAPAEAAPPDPPAEPTKISGLRPLFYGVFRRHKRVGVKALEVLDVG